MTESQPVSETSALSYHRYSFNPELITNATFLKKMCDHMYYSMIDLIALSGKLGIESTSINRCGKEGLKALIDIEAANAKRQLIQQQNSTVMGLPLNDVSLIKVAAQKHGLDRVVLFPSPVNGIIIPCFKIEGGDIAAFCQATGQHLLEKSAVNATETEQESMIHEYGVILYQR